MQRFILIIFLFTTVSRAEDSELTSIFENKGLSGTLIITTLDNSITYTHNDQRLNTPFLPASTFKPLHSLIALEEGAISGKDEVIQWDGIDRHYKPWNRDQTLESALTYSCIWFYQVITERLDNQTYLKHLKESEYGNMKTGNRLSSFWLDGDLAITANEQISFLRQLYSNQLPFSEAYQNLVKDLMLIEKNSAYTLYAKTGWVTRTAQQIGWYIGFIITRHNVWLFTTNYDIQTKPDAKHRKDIIMQALKIKKIIE